MEMLNAVQITLFEEVRRKKTIIEVANDYFERVKPKQILFEVKEEVKLVITKSIEELKEFIDKEVADLQEEGSACLIHCEKSGDFHMTSYWIDGTYLNVDSF